MLVLFVKLFSGKKTKLLVLGLFFSSALSSELGNYQIEGIPLYLFYCKICE